MRGRSYYRRSGIPWLDPKHLMAVPDPNGPYLFLCPWCRLWTPECDGGADAHPEACSACWCYLEAGERPVPDPAHFKRSAHYNRSLDEKIERTLERRQSRIAYRRHQLARAYCL